MQLILALGPPLVATEQELDLRGALVRQAKSKDGAGLMEELQPPGETERRTQGLDQNTSVPENGRFPKLGTWNWTYTFYQQNHIVSPHFT